jgi:hypothetical protein
MLGMGAKNKKQVIAAISQLKANRHKFEESIQEFQRHFVMGGAKVTAKLAAQLLEGKK